MADVTKDAIYELALRVRTNVGELAEGLGELKAEMQAFRSPMVAMHQDVANIYAILARHDTRLERIERRLGLVEPASD